MRWYPVIIITIVIGYLIGWVWFMNYLEEHKVEEEPKTNMNYQRDGKKGGDTVLDLVTERYKEAKQRDNN